MAPDEAASAWLTCSVAPFCCPVSAPRFAAPDMPTPSSSSTAPALAADRLRSRPTASLRLPLALLLGASLLSSGCAVVAVADAAVSVAATAVKVTATVVETTVDVAAAGVRAATKEDEPAPGAAPAHAPAPAPAPAPTRD